MLIHEPIVTWTTLYHSFVFGLLFLLLEAYPYIYASLYGMSREATAMVFLSPWAGNLLGVLVYFVCLKPQFRARRHQVLSQSAGKRHMSPEERGLPGILAASVLTPLGMFGLALTARADLPRALPGVLSGVPVGMGMTLVHLSLLNYYIDLYPARSASVVAANCAVRNAAAAVFPSVAVPLYAALGIRRASAVLAGVSCVGFPAAMVLLAYGKQLRARSRWALQDGVPGVGETSATPLLGQCVAVARGYGGTTARTS